MIDRARSILTENTAPDVDYRWTANPYRGCALDCSFCYARGTHEYADLDPDRDWASRISAKSNAASLLRAAFDEPRWQGARVLFSSVTDPYQPLEADLGLTRACLEVCREYQNPASVVTKSALCLRDLDLFASLAGFTIDISIAFSDAHAALLEPGAPSSSERFDLIASLAARGLDVGILIAPVLLGLNDASVVSLLERAASAGARRACLVQLRLPSPTASIFSTRLRLALPDAADRLLALARTPSGDYHVRGAGTGAHSTALHSLFLATCRRLGLVARDFSNSAEPPSPFRRPGQLPLF